jgi:hypothetical protein
MLGVSEEEAVKTRDPPPCGGIAFATVPVEQQ